MKYTPQARKISRRLATVCFTILLLGPGATRAAECPAMSPEDPQERRNLAKEWFSIAETAENNGNDIEATRAYACSYKMVAHPYTAYNLGRVADRSGNHELALKMFKAYLALKPDAQDKEEVKVKVKALEEKIAAAKVGGTSEAASTEEGGEKPAEPVREELAPPPEPKPAPVVKISKPAEPEPEAESPSHMAEWIVGGASVAALVTGIALNLAARSKMSACFADASKGDNKTANSECDSARPLAYTSYIMFGAAAAGATAEALLLLFHNGGLFSGNDSSSVGLLLLPSGGGLAARGRF
jgi:hypothetical protein